LESVRWWVCVWRCAILPHLSNYLKFKTTLYIYIYHKICPSWTKWNNMHFQMEIFFWVQVKYIKWIHTRHSKSQPLIFYICHNYVMIKDNSNQCRVELLIINTTLWPKTSINLCHLCFILSDLKCYENVTFICALEIIFEVPRKRSNGTINFSTYKTRFFFCLPLFGPLLLSNLLTFSFLIHFKQFKVL
jgi:hypothetical protein